MSIRWITSRLGTGAFTAVSGTTDADIVDVRDLVDKPGNESEAVLGKIHQGAAALRRGKRVVVCCDYGISRSNAVATGILSLHEGIGFDSALRDVQKATGETDIKLDVLMAVRNALEDRPGEKTGAEPRTILVTGGSGFIGQSFRNALGNAYRLLAPSRAELDVASGGTGLGVLAGGKAVACVVHLANPRIYTSNVAMGQTLAMLRNVIDFCLAEAIPLVYPSCWEVYSGYAGVLHAGEATPALPRGPFGETKYLAETLIGHCTRTAGLKCALLRSGPVYGRGGEKPRFIRHFIENALRSQPIVTHRYRNGNPSLDLLHVDDAAAAIAAVIRSGYTGSLNLGTGVLTSTRDIARMIGERLGSGSPVRQRAIDADVASIAMDARKAQAELGWTAEIPLEEGMADLISNIKERRATDGRIG